MGRGAFVHLSTTALLLASIASRATACLWCVSIDESPAPLPQDGPPFSAHASRNRALIPYQVIGILAAYVGFCLIIGTLFLTVGRKLRRRALSMSTDHRPTEMIKPMAKSFDPSPISPRSERSWYNLRHMRSGSIRSTGSMGKSPAVESVVSFDNAVIEADRMRRQEEMERLYAAVMADRPDAASSGSPPKYSNGNPPRLVTTGGNLRIPHDGPITPSTPMSPVRAIYPPGSQIPTGLASPTSPIRAELPFPPPQSTRSDLRVNRTPSFGSGKTQESTLSGPKKLRKSLRNIKISSPIVRDDDNSDGARTPLSPRFYANPGVPPAPPTARTTNTVESQPYTPTTPGSVYAEQDEHLDQVRDLPLPNPQRLSAYVYDNPAQQLTNFASTRGDPNKPGSSSASNNAPRNLPLRQYASTQQQHQASSFPLSPSSWNHQPPQSATLGPYNSQHLLSAGPIKTTFLETRPERFGAPRTAGPATPYSAYMPFTPVTPVTPHLTTRAERKQRKREEKAIKGAAIEEEDAVVDEGEMWGSGY